MRTWRRLTYTCDGDAKVVVNLHAKEARVVFKGRAYNMKQVEESDGQKYTGGSLVWRNKDEVGTLERTSKSGGSKSLASGCHLQSAGTNPPAAPQTNPPSQP
jgi:membrane-bound inhibitor of C-type lysozyme